MTFWHFTCEHSWRELGSRGTLRPTHHPLIPELPPMVWLTDLGSPPTAESVGLTNNLISCDRLAYRYKITEGFVHPWSEFADEHNVPADVRRDLERYAQPEHWFVSTQPLRATLA